MPLGGGTSRQKMRVVEEIELLVGNRSSKTPEKAAVRVEDLLPLLDLPAAKAPKVASDPPTKAEVDAILADQAAFRQALDVVIANIKARFKQEKRLFRL